MLRDILRQYRLRILVTYILIVTEFIAFALCPLLLGKAIDALLVDRYTDFGLYLSCAAFGMLGGFIRRRFDTRTFMQIWRDKTCGAVSRLLQSRLDASKIISRSNLARTYGDFLEYTLPSTLHAVIEIIVAAVVLSSILPLAAGIVIPLVILAMGIQYTFSQILSKIETEVQTINETKDAAIVHRDWETISQCYEGLRKKFIRRSDLDASSWALVDFLGIAAHIVMIVALVKTNQSIGTIMATLAYTDKIFQKTNFLSWFFNHLKQMQIANSFLSMTESIEPEAIPAQQYDPGKEGIELNTLEITRLAG